MRVAGWFWDWPATRNSSGTPRMAAAYHHAMASTLFVTTVAAFGAAAKAASA
jgi:hypothetical protein